MAHGISLVLDTTAVRAYAAGRSEVGQRIAELPVGVEFAAVPVLCLAEAYRSADSEEASLLDLLADHDSVIVTPISRDDALPHSREILSSFRRYGNGNYSRS